MTKIELEVKAGEYNFYTDQRTHTVSWTAKEPHVFTLADTPDVHADQIPSLIKVLELIHSAYRAECPD